MRLRAWATGWAVLIAAALAAGPVVARQHHHHDKARSDADDGRRHLKKADALAAKGRCADAVGEYTVADAKLDDPVILFKRAECYRELNQRAKAVDDYLAFLEAQPDAPNRAAVEARLAELEPDRRDAEATAPATPAAAPPPVATPLPAAPAKPAPAQPAAAVLVDQHASAPEAQAARDQPHSHWWLWTTVAVVAAGGAAAAYFLARPHPATAPATTLGTYQF